MKLYELTGQFSALDDFDIESGDDIQAYGDLYNGLEGQLKDKINAACMVIRNNESQAECIAGEIARLQARKKSAENKIQWLKGYMQNNLEKIGVDKVETNLFSVRIQANPPSVEVMVDVKNLLEKYQLVTIEVNKSEIAGDLKNGIIIDGCKLSQTKSLRVK